MEGINYLNNKGKSIVNINLKLDEPINGYDESVFFNQPIFEKFLRSEANKHNNIDIKLGYKLTNIDAQESINNLTLLNINNEENEYITSSYVLACDGANSFVRKALNIESFDYKFNLKKSLSNANENNSKFAIIIGEDEFPGLYSLKL